VAAGYQEGLIEPIGEYRFTLRGLPRGKGPYAWVSRNEQAQAQAPAVNWEYLVQAAEYALRKATYLIRYRLPYLSITAIGLRRDFQVTYPPDNRFTLIDDMVPLA
jgi:hypothetical protein